MSIYNGDRRVGETDNPAHKDNGEGFRQGDTVIYGDSVTKGEAQGSWKATRSDTQTGVYIDRFSTAVINQMPGNTGYH